MKERELLQKMTGRLKVIFEFIHIEYSNNPTNDTKK